MKFIFTLFLLVCINQLCAQQSVGIGTTTPNNSAILHLNSTTKGVLFPSMTEAQRNAIVSPARGLLTFQTDGEDGFYFNSSAIPSLPVWKRVSEGKTAWGTATGSNDDIRNLNTGGVVIGNPALASCAILHLSSTTGGLLLPRMTSTQRSAIVSPINGLVVYDNTTERFYMRQNDSWKFFLDSDYWIKNGNDVLNIGDSIGLNVVNPKERLEVGGNVRALGARFNNTSGNAEINFSASDVDKGFIQLTGTGGENFRMGTVSSNETGKFIVRTNGADRVFVDAGGNVSIGTSAVASGYKLSINGKAICEELKVQLSGNWPDYVFRKEYNLMPLSQLEQFINTNQHLPNIPKASEIEKSGIEVGDMQKRMMEKIEELTLYIIDLQKQVEELKRQQQ